MDGSGLRDLATAIGGAVIGAVAAWALVGGVTSVTEGSSEGRSTAAPSGVLERWDVGSTGWQRSVVQVRNRRCGDSISGTGVVVDGHVLTNVHVVDGATGLVVGTHHGHELPVVAVAVSGTADLAELTVADPGGELGAGLQLAPSGPALGGADRWRMAGFPAGTHYQERGVGFTDVLRGGRFPDPLRAWHLDAAVAGGESGSPIVDGSGRLAALLYARALADGDGLAMDVDTIRSARRTLVARGPTAC